MLADLDFASDRLSLLPCVSQWWPWIDKAIAITLLDQRAATSQLSQ
jgi:hypothetical protein